MNIVGRLRSNNFEKDGQTVYGMAFTAEEIDYLDSRAESEARRSGIQVGQGAEEGQGAAGRNAAPSAAGNSRKSRNGQPVAHA